MELTEYSIVLLNVVGQCGPLLGTRIFPKSEAPRYIQGQSICAGFMFFNAFLALSLRTLLVFENRKLDEKYGQRNDTTVTPPGDGKVVADAHVGGENYGSTFRYIL
jgi:hypothetical protein